MDGARKFDIHDRIFEFVADVILTTRLISKTFENKIILAQLLRSVTSIGANDQEANGVSTRKDFIHCYTIVRKEALETLYWLSLLTKLNNLYKDRMHILQKENKEIISIFSTIIKNAQNNHSFLLVD